MNTRREARLWGPANGHSLMIWLMIALSLQFTGRVCATPAAIRVVSQTVGTDEMLLALAHPEQIAALSHLAYEADYSAVAEEAKRYPKIESRGDAESILKFSPTLVLFAGYSRDDLVTQVRRAGVKTLVISKYQTLQDSFDNLRLVARELGAEGKAEEIIAAYEKRVEVLHARLRLVKPLVVLAPSTYNIIEGDGTTFQDLCDHAGADNAGKTYGKLHGDAPAPNEQMLTWPIDRMVVAGKSVEGGLRPYKGLPPYQFMPAVIENRAVLLKPYQLSCVSQYRVDGYEELARQLHPEAFR